MTTIKQWSQMSGKEQTIWLEKNRSGRSRRKDKLVFGVGVNDATYQVGALIGGDSVKCPAYTNWCAMIRRCYSGEYIKSRPNFQNVTVSKEWHHFMDFRSWWIENYVDGFCLDKDLIGDGLEHSPSKCIFVPNLINTFTSNNWASRGSHLVGTLWVGSRGKFRAFCSNPITGKQESLGYFREEFDAHLAWRTRKLELALELKPKMDEIDQRIYPRVVEIINNAK